MTTKEAEVTKTEAALNTAWDSHQDALADRAEEIKAAELPEVWELGDGHENGWHYKAGDTGATGWLSDSPAYHCRSARGGSGATQVTKAVYDNARALYHGADFTGRLDQIVDTPICELNKATRDEMFSLPFDAFECMVHEGWSGCAQPNDSYTLGNHIDTDTNYLLSRIYRLSAPKTRPMTQDECLGWAFNDGAQGWQVITSDGAAWRPCLLRYRDPSAHQRRTIDSNGVTGEPMPFEVPVK